MSGQETVRTLRQLHKICKAGERGFNISAKSVNNRGLKVMLKSYAQQRRQMADELKAMVEALGGTVSKRRSVRGIIHRGRITIMSTLAIGPTESENAALREAVVGENAAVKAYERALSRNLTPEARLLVQAQFEQVQAVSQRVNRLRGLPSDRLVVRLYNSEQDAKTAVSALQNVNFPQDAIEIINLSQTNDFYRHYQEENSVTGEATISGGLGGAIWGSIVGAVTAVAMVQFPGLEPVSAASTQATWGAIALGGALSGTLIGVILGFFIGLGVSEQDVYLYDNSIERGTTMVLLNTNRRRAPEASRIMRRINMASATAPSAQ